MCDSIPDFTPNPSTIPHRNKANSTVLISVESLRQRVADSKSKSTARYYLAMLNRLEQFVDAPDFDLNAVNPGFVADFGDFLVREGVTPSSVKLFQMSFRAVMKDSFGKENASKFKAAFNGLGSKNVTMERSMPFEEVVRLASLDLSDQPLLQNSLDIFLYSLFSAALPIDSMKSMAAEGTLRPMLPHQRRILRRFELRTRKSFTKCIESLDVKGFSDNLSIIGQLAGLSSTLSPATAADAWISAARKCDIPADLIAASIQVETDMAKKLTGKKQYEQWRIDETRLTVANRISDERLHWYVMRCYAEDSMTMAESFGPQIPFLRGEAFRSFVPPPDAALDKKLPGKKRKTTRPTFMGSLLFINCTQDVAQQLKRYLGADAYIYTHPATSLPAPISDREMLTFMLLCEVSTDTITYHFPTRQTLLPAIEKGRTARITRGNAVGQVGIIEKISTDRYKVSLTFSSLGGARVTATVPIEFITPV